MLGGIGLVNPMNQRSRRRGLVASALREGGNVVAASLDLIADLNRRSRSEALVVDDFESVLSIRSQRNFEVMVSRSIREESVDGAFDESAGFELIGVPVFHWITVWSITDRVLPFYPGKAERHLRRSWHGDQNPENPKKRS